MNYKCKLCNYETNLNGSYINHCKSKTHNKRCQEAKEPKDDDTVSMTSETTETTTDNLYKIREEITAEFRPLIDAKNETINGLEKEIMKLKFELEKSQLVHLNNIVQVETKCDNLLKDKQVEIDNLKMVHSNTIAMLETKHKNDNEILNLKHKDTIRELVSKNKEEVIRLQFANQKMELTYQLGQIPKETKEPNLKIKGNKVQLIEEEEVKEVKKRVRDITPEPIRNEVVQLLKPVDRLTALNQNFKDIPTLEEIYDNYFRSRYYNEDGEELIDKIKEDLINKNPIQDKISNVLLVSLTEYKNNGGIMPIEHINKRELSFNYKDDDWVENRDFLRKPLSHIANLISHYSHMYFKELPENQPDDEVHKNMEIKEINYSLRLEDKQLKFVCSQLISIC